VGGWVWKGWVLAGMRARQGICCLEVLKRTTTRARTLKHTYMRARMHAHTHAHARTCISMGMHRVPSWPAAEPLRILLRCRAAQAQLIQAQAQLRAPKAQSLASASPTPPPSSSGSSLDEAVEVRRSREGCDGAGAQALRALPAALPAVWGRGWLAARPGCSHCSNPWCDGVVVQAPINLADTLAMD